MTCRDGETGESDRFMGCSQPYSVVHDHFDGKVVPSRFQPRSRVSVITVGYEKWQKRPMARVVLREGADATPTELEAHLAESFPDWWLPDEYGFLDQITQTIRGKSNGKVLREQFDDVVLEATDDE